LNVYNYGNYIYLTSSADFYILEFLTSSRSEEKSQLGKKINKKSELKILENEIVYTTTSKKNKFVIYDIMGKEIYRKENGEICENRFKKDKLKSGIYFIEFIDGSNKIKKK